MVLPSETPPQWTHEELESARQEALARFVAERGEEGSRRYEAAFHEQLAQITRLFHETDDLRAFSSAVFQDHPDLLSPARYLAAPPISEDDLNTLVGGNVAKRRRIDKELADRAIEILQAAWDAIRFPWLAENRGPTPSERDTALKWTAGILAIERTRTHRRGESSKRQEAAVLAGLHDRGWQSSRLKQIDNLDDLARGSYAYRVKLARFECDIAVRLRDGRLLALECKVSNTATNSIKRLNHEVGHKAGAWRSEFGQRVIPAAVLAGVFKLGSLLEAQDTRGITIFWEHNLNALFDLVNTA